MERWAALKRVHALNERCLEVLLEFARTDDSPTTLAMGTPLRSLWRDLDAMARMRAAQSITRAMHVVRAMSEILGRLQFNHHDHILLGLYDLESGMQFLVDGLRKVRQP
jgi:hypothetical protein